MKEKESKLFIANYGYDIIFIKTNNIIKSRKKRNNTLGKFNKSKLKYADGLHCDNDYQSYIFLNSNPNIGVLAHECYHAIKRMFKWIHAKKVDEEIFAYNLGYCIDKANEFYKNKE